MSESGDNVLPLERRRIITENVSINRSVKVVDLSLEFNVTEETIRRDLEKLEKKGVLKRTYGGAVRMHQAKEDLPHGIRLKENPTSKKRIGKLVSQLIQDGDVIMLGTGTTNLECGRKISGLKDITVITNSFVVVSGMVQDQKTKIICIGGELDRKALGFIGPTAVKNIQGYYADKVIISCKGIDMEKGIMESSEMETDIKRAMIKNGNTVILAVDHTKFNQLSLTTLFDFSQIDIVATDIEPSKKWMEFFEKEDILCIF